MVIRKTGVSLRVLLVGHARRVVKLSVLAFAFAQMASAVTVFYVTTNGTGNLSGSDWANATNDLQGAIDAIETGAANTVWVSNGVYEVGGRANYPVGSLLTNRVEISKIITVRSANNDPANTIIKGNRDPIDATYGLGPAAVRCVSLIVGSSLIGFTLTNGATMNEVNHTNDGGGVTGSASTGGGTVSNCIITGNSCGLYGGGAGYVTLRNCMIVGNNAPQGGGGAGHSTLYSCTLSGNYAGSGGGAFNSTLYNCLVIGNSSGGGGGMQIDSVGSMYNCTIVGNKGGAGGGVRATHNSTLYINNCIIYSNDATSGAGSNYYSIYAGYTPTINFTNSCTTPTNDVWAAGNITNDPMFIAYGNGYGTNHVAGNYRLQANSPCLNTGINFSWMSDSGDTRSKDLDGRRRIDRLYGRVDMGAYEFIHKITLISGH